MAMPRKGVRMLRTRPPELVVYDEPGECSYLPDQIWRLPLRMPIRALTRAEFEQRLGAGDRRQGRLLYRTRCPSCQACEPIRVDVEHFAPSRSQRRVLARGNRHIQVVLGPIKTDEHRVRLYNRHKQERGLDVGEGETGSHAYRMFLGDSCCTTFEMRYYVANQLVGVAIVDFAEQSLSAVYCYYDPDYGKLSLGTFSILRQIELCRRWSLRHLYLGLYIAACPPMAYKSRFLPHERLVDGTWQRTER